jgi:transposase
MNENTLINILDREGVLDELVQNGTIYFQQDNHSAHKTNRVISLIDEKGLINLEWCPYSPDLNPIEQVWAILKKKVSKLLLKIRVENANELWRHVERCFEEIDEKVFDNLLASMPARVNEVINNLGGPAKA